MAALADVGEPDWTPMIRTDREAFERLALDVPEPDKRMRAYPRLRDALVGEAMRSGARIDTDQRAILLALYAGLFLEKLTAEHRRDAYRVLIDVVRTSPFVCPDGLIPFWLLEPDADLAARAMEDYASLSPVPVADPMAAVREPAELLPSEELGNRGAVFVGLLGLGDRRVTALLRPHRGCLTGQDLAVIADMVPEVVADATVEFMIDWLEGLGARAGAKATFGSVATALARLGIRARATASVVLGDRRFPIGTSEEDRRRRQDQSIPAPDYADRIAPRLRAIARDEPPMRVMPQVMAAWGIG